MPQFQEVVVVNKFHQLQDSVPEHQASPDVIRSIQGAWRLADRGTGDLILNPAGGLHDANRRPRSPKARITSLMFVPFDRYLIGVC